MGFVFLYTTALLPPATNTPNHRARRVSPAPSSPRNSATQNTQPPGQNLRNELTALDATHLNINVNDGRHRNRFAST